MSLPKTLVKNIVLQEVGSELLIYNMDTNVAYSLNETAKIIYDACGTGIPIAEVSVRYNFSYDLIFLTLDELKKTGLLDKNTAYKSPFSGLPRREAINKAGLGTITALPIVATIVAPSSITAQSLGGLRSSCTTSADCHPSASNCTETPLASGQTICCVGSISYYDTGGIVNSCGGPTACSSFTCQFNADNFCCSGSATVTCSSPTSCACVCN